HARCARSRAQEGGTPQGAAWYPVLEALESAPGVHPANAGVVFGGSSSGRTTDSDSVYLGSNPSPPANEEGPSARTGPFFLAARLPLPDRGRRAGHRPRRLQRAAIAETLAAPLCSEVSSGLLTLVTASETASR